jgi:hypothetical protein
MESSRTSRFVKEMALAAAAAGGNGNPPALPSRRFTIYAVRYVVSALGGRRCDHYTRPIRRFYLTPPKVLTFIISLVLAVVAVLAVYGHVAPLHGVNGFVFLLVAWIVLTAGVLVRGI